MKKKTKKPNTCQCGPRVRAENEAAQKRLLAWTRAHAGHGNKEAWFAEPSRRTCHLRCSCGSDLLGSVGGDIFARKVYAAVCALWRLPEAAVQ